MKNIPAAVGCFAIAMAFLEAAVVIYLRALYYPEGFNFPLKPFRTDIVIIEMIREAATIVMLASVAWIAGRRFIERFAYFAFAFGMWDIFYYIFLKLTLDWPASIFDWDVLFLIPPMVGPVLAPIIVSACLIIAGLIVIRLERSGRSVTVSSPQWIFSIIGGCVIIFSFVADPSTALGTSPSTGLDLSTSSGWHSARPQTLGVSRQPGPADYHWLLFIIGLSAGIISFANVIRNPQTSHKD